MNWRSVFAIAKKDIREAFQNKGVSLPILIVPTIFILIIPLGLILATSLPEVNQGITDPKEMETLVKVLPPFITRIINGFEPSQMVIVMMLGYFFAPFFLILPLMFSTVIASESFAGERERKTIEALLYTPATDAELFLGKVLASLIPAVAITWISFIVYTILVNGAAFHLMGSLWFPLAQWYPLIFWVSPAISLLGIAVTVLISVKTQTFMGAYQTSGSLVVLVLGVLVGQITGVLYMNVWMGLLLGLVFWIADVVLIFLAIRTFNRTRLLASVT
jgi:ABC-type Na+ efflux pump permease subunit